METHENQSPASSITKLGYVRFAIPEGQDAPGSEGPPGRIIELPSFTNEESARPTVQMPPLTDEHGEPLPVDEAFDPGGGEAPADAANDSGGHEEPAPAGAQRSRSSTLLGVVPFAVPTRGSSPEMSIAAAEEAAQEATVTEVASIVVSESLWAAEAPVVAAVVATEAPAMSAAPVAVAVGVAPAAYAPVLDDADEELEPLPRAAFAWWHIALAGGALATIAGAIGVAALT